MDTKTIIDHFKGQLGNSTADVRKVLTYIDKPGKQRELKHEVINELFTASSPQGFTVADTLESYEEY